MTQPIAAVNGSYSVDLGGLITPGMSKMNRSHALIFAASILMLGACNDLSIEPTPFNYPIQLTLSQKQYAVEVSWDKSTVSSFEEYFILRSTDSIPDLDKPEVSGLITIADRIDDRDIHTFTDTQFPIATTMFYKVYVKIGERFLMSPTRRIDLSLQLIDLRADVFGIDQAKNEMIAFDRGRGLLFTYNYETEEITGQEPHSFNFPKIIVGTYNGADEIYINDRNVIITVINRETLKLKTSFSVTYNVLDFTYDEGRFYIARNGPSQGSLAVYRRSSGTQATSLTNVINFVRNVHFTGSPPNEKIYDLSFNQAARYSVSGNSISLDKFISPIVPGSQVLSVMRPDFTEMVLTNAGQIVDANLENVVTLEGGNNFYQWFAYSQDGATLFGAGFEVNQSVVRSYDANDNYALIERFPLNFNPTGIFSDGGNVYAIGVVFLNGIARTIIAKFPYE